MENQVFDASPYYGKVINKIEVTNNKVIISFDDLNLIIWNTVENLNNYVVDVGEGQFNNAIGKQLTEITLSDQEFMGYLELLEVRISYPDGFCSVAFIIKHDSEIIPPVSIPFNIALMEGQPASVYEFLNMQRNYYDNEASRWALDNKDPVVGNWALHEAWSDYDNYLFKSFDTTGKIALEYGCGPGRNLVRYANRFKRVDGVDISPINIQKANEYLVATNSQSPNLYANDGASLPMISTDTYDCVFSVICMQHICNYKLRTLIVEEIYRVLKPGGYFCFQMGYGGRPNHDWAKYNENVAATTTNGGYDVSVLDPNEIKEHMESLGFVDFKYDIRECCSDVHMNWIWVEVRKPE